MELKGFMYAASKDVDAASANYAINIDRFAESIAFHSQQAAEKMVKAALASSGVVPDQTHKIDSLVKELATAKNIALNQEVIEAATDLTYHAVSTRYAFTRECDGGMALTAIQNCNVIADFLSANGFESLHIEKSNPFSEEDGELFELMAKSIASSNSAENTDRATTE